MTFIISKEQLENAAIILDSSSPVEFYKYLSDNGLKYATLANGVASESSLSATSIGYLIEAAHDGGVDLSDQEVETIKVGMANKYLDALRAISDKDPSGNVSRDINFDEAELFHRQLFESYHLPSDTWTMKIIYDVLPVEARDAYWQQALLSAGDFYYESVFTLATVYLMGQQTLIPEHSAQAWTWFDRLLSVPVGEEAGAVAAHSLMDMMIVLANMPGLILPGVTNHVLDRSLGMKAYDPLVLDLDGDGIETLGVQDGVKFDFDGDGIKTGTGWIAKDDGILVFDRNGNSTIDNGSELFGIDTIKRNGEKALDGLDAIRDLDTNGDGVFDGADSDFGRVLVWQDLNGNGVSEANEMKSLIELGIKSIGLNGQPLNVDSNGNMLSAMGEFTRVDGTSGMVGSNIQNSYNINFATNNFLSEFTEVIEPNPAFDDIPKISGSGKVRNLYEASILDEQLATQVRDFLVMVSDGKGAPLMDGILARWASTGNSKSIEERFEEAGGLQTGFTLDLRELNQSFDAHLGNDFLGKLLIVEKFIGNDLLTFTIDTNGNTQHLAVEVYGNQFHFYNDSSSTMIIVADDLKNPSVQQSVDQIYQQLFTDTYLSLSASALFDSYLQDMKVEIKDRTIHYNFEDVGAALSLESHDNPLKVIRIAIDIATFYGDTDGTLTALIARLAANMPETELAKIGPLPAGIIFTDKLIDKSLIAFGKNIVIGGEQDLLRGISGDDNISTWNTNDVIFAGTGNDTIRSAGGLDTYVFAKNSGNDNLHLSSYDDNAYEKIVFSEMSVSDVHSITKRGDLLEVLYGDNSILTIHNFFDQSTLQGGFVFNNGQIWSKLDILKHTVVGGTDGNDFVYGFNEAYNQINSGTGDDTIYAGDLGANIVAGAGNDLVFGGISDDEINGGSGDDILNGNSGQDSFYFAKGDGNDEIVFTTSDRDLSDKVILTDTQSTEPVSFTRIGDSLVLRYSENDSINLKDFFYDNSILSGGIVFADQVTWSRSDILGKTVVNGTDGDDQVWGFNGGFNNIFAKAGNDLIYVGDSGSMVDAGEGDDTIYGGAGNDALIGGKGDDTIQSGSGLDIFYFSKGDGKDTLQVNNYDSNPNDRIVLTDIVSTDQVKIARVGDSLIFNFRENDSITFKDFFYNDLILSGGIVFADQVTWSRKDILERTVIIGSERDDQVSGFNGVFNNIFAGAGNDLISVGDSGSRVDAGEGNDNIFGGVGNDTLIGGKGNDVLDSSRGLDTFIFSKGDGLDTIITPYSDDNVNDKIIFSDVLASDIRSLLSIDGSLVINYADGDKITVKDFFASESTLSGGLIFSDQSAWSRQDLLEKAITQGSSSDDSILGNNQAQNKIFAGAGNDTILAGSKGSTIFGEGGDDLIIGGAGIDLITGGTGNDTIHNSDGADTYFFQLGDGQDTIFTGNLGIDPNDSITFSGLTSTQANFEKNDADLVIKYGINDELLLKDYFANEGFLGGVQFDDVLITKPQIEDSISMYSAPELTVLGQSPMHPDFL